MFRQIRADIDKKRQLAADEDGFLGTLLQRGTLAVVVYRFGRFAGDTRTPVVGFVLTGCYWVLFYLIQMFTGIRILPYSKIGSRFVVRNHTGIFVVAESIGSDFTVCEGVTVGNVRGKSHLPILGDNVYLEPGCKVLGEVTIGDNVVVRANSLVISDVPSNSIAIGNPARVLPMANTAA